LYNLGNLSHISLVSNDVIQHWKSNYRTV